MPCMTVIFRCSACSNEYVRNREHVSGTVAKPPGWKALKRYVSNPVPYQGNWVTDLLCGDCQEIKSHVHKFGE